MSIALLLLAGLFRAGAAPSPERWLPTNTVAFVSLPHAPAARQAWRSQAPGRLASDPAMAAFRTHFHAQAERQFWAPLSRLTGLAAGELPDLAEGQVTLALVDESAGNPSGLVLSHLLVLDSGARASKLQAWLDRRDPNPPGTTVSLLGVPFTAIPIEPDALDAALGGILSISDPLPVPDSPPRQPLSLFVGRKDSLLVLGTSTNVLLSVLNRLQDPSPPFMALGSIHENAVVQGTLILPPFLRSLSANPLSLGALAGPEGGPSLARIATALGLHEVRHASFAIRSATEGWYVDFHLAIPEATRRGLFTILSLQPSEAGPPPFVPADTRRFTRVRFPGPAAWRGLEKTLGDIDPTLLGVLQLFTGYAGKTDDADFDFQKGIIDLLGDDWLTFASPTGAGRTNGSLLLVASSRASELLRGIQLVASPTYLATFFPPGTPPPQRTTHTLHGHPVTSIALPPMPWRDGATGAVHFASLEGYVAFTSQPEMLEGFLSTNPPPSLAALPGFRDAVARVGGTGEGYFSYTDERHSAATVFEALKRSPHALSENLPWIAVSPTATGFIAAMEHWIDVSLLPPFQQIAPQFGIRITRGRRTPEGFEVTTFRPAPPP